MADMTNEEGNVAETKTEDESYEEQVAPEPRLEESVPAEAVLKHLLSTAMRLHAITQKLDTPAFHSDVDPEDNMALRAYMYALLAANQTTATASALRALMRADPDAAQQQALSLVLMSDEGDAPERMWEWAEEAGLDPDRLYNEHLAAVGAERASDRLRKANEAREVSAR